MLKECAQPSDEKGPRVIPSLRNRILNAGANSKSFLDIKSALGRRVRSWSKVIKDPARRATSLIKGTDGFRLSLRSKIIVH